MLIIFDLDFTLWDCGGTWCDHTTPPYIKQNELIRDADHRKIRLYPEVFSILEYLKKRQVEIGVASRTSTPEWADELMRLFDIHKFFDHFEIYPGSKLSHFKSLQYKTQLPYEDMVFFDDEYRNIDEVGELGVRTVLVENGISKRLIQANFI
jgi:magnesium-dependent phosphatase 1